MHKQGKSWGLWLVPAIGGLAILSGAYAELMRRPTNAQEEFRIALQELRSELEEAGLLARHARNGDPLRNFVAGHAHQLEKHLRATVDGVRTKGSDAGQKQTSEAAARRGEEALAALQRLQAEPANAASLDDVASTMERESKAISGFVTALPPRSP